MATKQKANLEAQLLSWGSAAGLGALVFVLLIVLGGWGIIQAIWMAGVAFVLLGAFNYFVFAAPNPPLAGRMDPFAEAPVARAPAPAAAPAPKPAPPAATRPAPAPAAPPAAPAAAPEAPATAKAAPKPGPADEPKA